MPGSKGIMLGVGHDEVTLGMHICSLYRTAEERDRIAIPFIREGIREGACCKYVVDEQTATDLEHTLRAHGIDAVSSEASGQLSILTAAQTYLASDAFNPATMIALLGTIAGEVRSQGWPHLRYTGEATFILQDAPGFDQFMRYESALNDHIPKLPMVVLCQYNVTKFSGDLVMGVLQTHPYAVLGGVLVKNPYYVDPTRFLPSHHRVRLRPE
jgi:hypothetical protein